MTATSRRPSTANPGDRCAGGVVIVGAAPGVGWYLIDLGRVEEAVAVLRQHKFRPPRPSTTAWSAEPPF
jgi:hypothetical protein